MLKDYDGKKKLLDDETTTDVVEFEVSGRVFRESRAIIEQFGENNMLRKLLLDKESALGRQANGNMFLTRNATAFEMMLTFIKSNGTLVPHDPYHVTLLKSEL